MCFKVQAKCKHETCPWLYMLLIYKMRIRIVDSMMTIIQKDIKLVFNKSQMFRVKKKVFKMDSGSDSEQYAMLWPYGEEIKKSNLGTTVKIKYKYVVICLDVCHIRSSTGGIFLSVVGNNGNNCMYPFTYIVVEKKKMKSWLWFICLLSAILLHNISKSFNSLILRARDKLIECMLEIVRLILMNSIHMRGDQMEKYNRDLYLKVSKHLEELKKKSMEFRLHLGEKTCSCRVWELTGILVHMPFTIIIRRRYLKTYNHLMGALNNSDICPKVDMPPLIPVVCERLPERPKKHDRIKEPGVDKNGEREI
ncbi:hypothetical protein Pfo_018261 [Paulownia fortunei]|nr:hypothetical protein Pfo_018261 [Paulownia fortunei]